LRKYARLIIALFGVVFAAFVALQFKRRTPSATPQAVVRADPTAVVESTGGATQRFKSSREDVRVRYDRLLTYSDGTSTFLGVTITTVDRGDARRSYTVTAKQGKSGQNESSFVLDGDVHLASTDGMTVRAGHATYADADGSVNASGPVEFAKGRMRGHGIGMQYDKNRNALSILENAAIHIDAENGDKDTGPTEVTAATALFLRSDRLFQFTGNVRIRHGAQTMEAEAAAARISPDEKRVETLELHTNARIDVASPAPGALQTLAGSDMTLTYAADGQSLQRALIVGNAAAQLAGEPGSAGRQIIARVLDVTMAPDGTTPVSLSGQDSVRLTLPADPSTPARTIDAAKMESKGEPGRGLTRSTFTGGVQFREKGPTADRVARSAALEAAMQPGMGAIDEARFLHAARFEDGSLTAQGAQALYDVSKGTLQLTGSEPGSTTPRVVNDRIAVDATQIDVGLEGPVVKAAGAVKSTLKPNSDKTDSNGGAKLPSMLKQDQPVTVLADNLAYDGGTSMAVYTGSARLFQADTTIKGNTITIDETRGDLTAVGDAMSSTVREQEGSDHKTQRTRSTGSAADLKYEDGPRLLTYTGGAHLIGPEGDITAAKIQLYLQAEGDDVDRAEAYADDKEKMTLREQTRTTTGLHMTYTAARETYVVTGVPATVVDDCGRETIGKTLTFVKSTDTIVVDGNQQIRTRTRGGSGKCQ
jgi:LPS export ABC transporter protein LptC/lipopolysaccharide transport protein LptA